MDIANNRGEDILATLESRVITDRLCRAFTVCSTDTKRFEYVLQSYRLILGIQYPFNNRGFLKMTT